MIRHVLRATLAAVSAAALLSGCGGDTASTSTSGSTATTPASATARVILDWYPNADHAGLVGAIDQGAFRDEGLTVTTVVPADPAASLKQVAAGKAEFALSYQPEVILARNAGVPVVAVGALVGSPLNSVIARTDRGIRRPRDLEGRTVGAAGVPSDRVLLDTIVRSDGGDPAKVRMRNIGYNLSPALAAGKVDAVIGVYWNIEAPELRGKGVPITVLRLDRFGVPSYDELVVVTSDRLAATEPDLIRRFLTGLTAGQSWAARNPAAATALLLRTNPDLSKATLPAQVAATAPLLAPPASAPLVISPDRWARFTDWMVSTKQLTPANGVDLTKAVNASFLPAP